MARFFHWHGRDGRWHHRWHRHEGGGDEPDPGPGPGPGPGFHLPFPLPLPFNLETSEGEDEFSPPEAEMHRRHWPKRTWQQGNYGMGENEFTPTTGTETETRPKSGRWVRHHNGIRVLGV
jgi:hypothetical protein